MRSLSSVHRFFSKPEKKVMILFWKKIKGCQQQHDMSALLISFIYLFILSSCFNPWSLKAKNECNVLENEEHVTVSKSKTKGKGVCVLGSLVRRYIKAIQLIDEAFYRWRVRSSCHSLSFFFFFNHCLSFTSPCIPILPLLLWSPAIGLTLYLNCRAAVATEL